MRVLVGKMKVEQANLYQNDFTAGLPSPFAALGLADVIGVTCGLDRWSTRVLPVFHDIQISNGRTRPEMKMKDNSRKYGLGKLSETMTGRVEFSLILDFQDRVNCDVIEEKIKNMRFAGSPIFGVKDKIYVEEINDTGDALFSCRRGFAFTPLGLGAAPFSPVSYGEEDSLETLYKTLTECRQEKGSWYVPAAVSYAFLENPDNYEMRLGVRHTQYPHIFVEPGASIGELVSIRNKRLTDVEEDALRNAFWSWHVTKSAVFAHKIYS